MHHAESNGNPTYVELEGAGYYFMLSAENYFCVPRYKKKIVGPRDSHACVRGVISPFSRVVSHLFTGSSAGIGKLPALSGWYIWYGMYGIFCTVRFGGSSILWNFAGTQKGGLVHQKGGRSEQKRGSRQINNTEGPYRVFLRYRLGKYQENTNQYHTEISNWDTTLPFSAILFYRQNFSEFGHIHLKFSLPFHIPYLLPFSLSLIHLSGNTGRIRPQLILASITRSLHINTVRARLYKHLFLWLLPRHDLFLQIQPWTDPII